MATLRARSVELLPYVEPARAKRAIDVIGSVLGLLVLAPVLAIVALAVRLSSPGPVIFAQERCGLGGRRFRFYKFRTMVDGAQDQRASLDHLNEMSGPVFKIARDPRITRVGAILRKTSLDELPQLWNVLRGEMSLVGPRPPMPDEVAHYDLRQLGRLSVVPGITGLWQVSGRSTINDFDTWLALDLEYVRRWSLWLDLRILAKTIVVVISARGAQ
ncbi:MAG: sugar transferase [Kofleriaceae bacterium]